MLSTSERTTLPPLRAVANPVPVRLPGIEHIHSLNDLPCSSRTLPSNVSYRPSTRKFSTSSSATTESRSPSPSLSDASSYGASKPFMRLVPSDMANAEAVVVVPPPGPDSQKPLLLIGPALSLINHPKRRIARGARIYPYRREMRPSHSRKTSWALTDCSEL
ncbi:hypothetical protein BDP27DRAFT_1412636 [Rhodocollybia butyracea]|uniref:Uncharacterized protein n=1 Tax=Rhodocollybia butyracea TaxID=206335 RepID=A0A9P5QCB4_9AGAR|nr:hypothetical protein BDP27DRAFT_1412636 [Rhodocollybia butyracea]